MHLALIQVGVSQANAIQAFTWTVGSYFGLPLPGLLVGMMVTILAISACFSFACCFQCCGRCRFAQRRWKGFTSGLIVVDLVENRSLHEPLTPVIFLLAFVLPSLPMLAGTAFVMPTKVFPYAPGATNL